MHSSQLSFSGIYVEGVTPLPIPNREVKPPGADGTMWVTAWESRSMPDFILKTPSDESCLGFSYVMQSIDYKIDTVP